MRSLASLNEIGPMLIEQSASFRGVLVGFDRHRCALSFAWGCCLAGGDVGVLLTPKVAHATPQRNRSGRGLLFKAEMYIILRCTRGNEFTDRQHGGFVVKEPGGEHNAAGFEIR